MFKNSVRIIGIPIATNTYHFFALLVMLHYLPYYQAQLFYYTVENTVKLSILASCTSEPIKHTFSTLSSFTSFPDSGKTSFFLEIN